MEVGNFEVEVVSVREFRVRLSQLLEAIASGALDYVFITSRGRRVAAMVPLTNVGRTDKRAIESELSKYSDRTKGFRYVGATELRLNTADYLELLTMKNYVAVVVAPRHGESELRGALVPPQEVEAILLDEDPTAFLKALLRN